MRNIFIAILLFISMSLSGQSIIGAIASSGGSSAAYGSELITNGDMGSATGWVLDDAGSSVTGGAMVVNSANNYTTMFSQLISMTVGHTYKIEFDVTSYTSGSIRFILGDINTGTNKNDISYYEPQHVSVELLFDNAATTVEIAFYSWSAGCVMSIDNVSVKEVL